MWTSLVGLVALGLAACAFPPTTGQGLIVWHTWSEAEAPVIEQVLVDFQRLHPEVRVSVERKPYTTALDEFAAASHAGLGPDVLIGVESVYAHLLNENGLATNLRAVAIDWTRFDANTLLSVEGQSRTRVGAPLNAYVGILFYNPTLIDAPPKTLADLMAMSQQGVKVGIPTTFFAGYWGITGLGGTVFDGDALGPDAEASLATWLTWLVTFQQTPGAVLSPDMRALVDGFARGDIALLAANSLELASLKERMGSDGVAVAPIPGFPQARPFSNVEVMVMNSASVQHEAVALLINFMTNETQQRKLARSTSGRAPVNRKVGRLNETLYPHVSVILKQNRAAVVPTTGQDRLINHLIVAADPVYQQVLEGVLSPEDGAREIVALVSKEERETP